MGLSVNRAQAHIKAYSAKLHGNIKCWPRYVFHAAQAEVVVEILRSGYLLPRAHHQNPLTHDVANQGAIASNPHALDYARMYFRPKNAFHLKTEGIKLQCDRYRDKEHMSLPVMLAFSAESVLTDERTGFSRGKLAGAAEVPGFDVAFFNTIPFDDVYHDGPTHSDEIRNMRMSEVVYPDALPLEPHLEAIVCRNAYERTTLLHLLGDDAIRWRKKIFQEQTPGTLFMRWGLYLREAQIIGDQLTLGFHPPRTTFGRPHFAVKITQRRDGATITENAYDWPFAAVSKGVLRGVNAHPHDIWEVQIEEVISFIGPIPTQVSSVV